jgi:hypothetical protein
MNNLIENEIQDLKEDLPKFSHLSDEYLFSFVCFKYFYNDGRLDYKDYSDCFVDGKLDGGIDLITVDESDEQVRLVLIQSKLISQLKNKQDVIDMFTKMDQTFRNFQEYKYAKYNKRLKRIFKDKLAFVEDQMPIYEFDLFLSVSIDKNRKNEINRSIEDIEELNKYQIRAFYKEEIEEQIRNVKEPKYFISEGKIKFEKKDGIIEYGDNGLLINISSNSIRDLYDKYRDKGLFEQNFRYFIRNKRIDDSINDSLKKKRGEFWFLNNGIIIGCKDFVPDGYYIRLYDFSIINGCQTATLIGEYRGKNEGEEFFLPCKIVKPIEEGQFYSFIADIAEASNSQKPISDRDLKSNRREQRELQKELKKEDQKIYVEKKRGEQLVSPAKKKQLKKWQYLKNDLYGQIILSFHLQSPGTARSSKKRIFSVTDVYDKIFKRKIDKNNVIDLLKLHSFYIDYLNGKKPEDYATPEQESVTTNGTLVILAITGFMIKVKKGLINLKKISDEEEWEREITEDNLEGKIFKDLSEDVIEERLNGFFSEIIEDLEHLYKDREAEEKTVSNFFKTDLKYRNVILRRFINRYYTKGAYKEKFRDYYLDIFT